MTMHQPTGRREIERSVAGAIHAHWMMFLIEGIILVVLGIAAIIVPVIATLAFTLVIGWLFLISGGVGLVTTFWMRSAPGFWWALLSAVVGLAAGIILLRWPISGTVSPVSRICSTLCWARQLRSLARSPPPRSAGGSSPARGTCRTLSP